MLVVMTPGMLDYAEQAGLENIKFHIACADSITKEANTTLTILLAAGGASLGYGMKLIEVGNHPFLLGGTIAMFARTAWKLSAEACFPSSRIRPSVGS